MKYFDLINRLDPRQQVLAAAGSVILVVALLVSYGLMPSIKAHRQSSASLEVLASVMSEGKAVSDQLISLSTEVEALDRELNGDMANLPEEQLESFVIGRLQSISWRNNVELLSIEPSAGEAVQNFQELLFRVELGGNYFDLHRWLQETNAELGFVVVKEYAMAPIESVPEDPDLGVTLTIASYRLMSSS